MQNKPLFLVDVITRFLKLFLNFYDGTDFLCCTLMLSSCEACYWSAYDCHGMSIYDNQDNTGKRVDKEDGGGSRDIHAVPPPPPVPPSPLEPGAVQRVGSPSGWRVHRGCDLPLTSPTPVGSTSTLVDPSLLTLSSPPSPGKPSLPPDVKPLPGCSDPDFCVGGLDHLCFRAPGGADPTRDQIVWVTRRYFNQ